MRQPYTDETYQHFKKPLYQRTLQAIREGRFSKGFNDWIEENICIYPVSAYHKFISPRFTLDNKTYNYYISKGNAVVDERSVELPIAWNFIEPGRDLLEIGNVLNIHLDKGYTHIVVDKYEQGLGIVNQDIVDYNPKKKFDMIISLSTIEHIGFDEEIKDPKKVKAAMDKILSLLKPDGKLLITMPMGYNPAVDKYVKTTKLRRSFMVKSSMFNDWQQSTEEEARLRPYNSKFKRDNAIVILTNQP